MVELCDTAIIANLFRVLAIQGCRRFILGSKGANNTLNLSNYFKAGEGFFKRLGIADHQDFSYQPLYMTRAARFLRYCMNYFDINDDLLVVSGDNLIDIDLPKIVQFHQKHKPVLTVALKEIAPGESISSYGVARVDDDLRIQGFVEKPRPGSEPSRMINTAFYLFSPQVREVLTEMGDRARDIGGDLIPYLIEKGYPVYGFPISGYWIDIGTPERLHQAAMIASPARLSTSTASTATRPISGFIPAPSPDRAIASLRDITLKGDVSIGRNCRIERGSDRELSYFIPVSSNAMSRSRRAW